MTWGTCEHEDFPAHAVQGPNGLRRFGLHGVRQGNQQLQLSIDGHIDHGLAVVFQGLPAEQKETQEATQEQVAAQFI